MIGWIPADMVDLGDFTLIDVNLVVFAVIGVSFAIIWLIVNFYHFYPALQFHVVARLLGGATRQDTYVDPVPLPADTDDLPTIDVLLPAYQEGNVINQSIGSIRESDYPQDLITINVLVEPDDVDTRQALDALREQYQFRELTIPAEYSEIVVPDTYPGAPNKPRALNYGFEITDGDIVGVIDAEDVVDEDLFRHVYSGLVVEERDYVQGILDMVNEDDGWLNLLFRAEYAWWFRWLLPGFDHVDFPVPLGGTTNFFHREVLAAMSERRIAEYGDPWGEAQREWFAEAGLTGAIPWDPRNVTEDFELGLFLWKEGYELGLLEVVTREESPLGLEAWIRQRTRWQKGKLYTFIQYAYTPPSSLRSTFHVFLQSFLPHLAPINLAGIVILALVANILGLGMPIGVFVALTLALVFLVMIVVVYAGSYVSVAENPPLSRLLRTGVVSLSVPLYWLPLWGAELRAMAQIYTNDLGWEKTPHHGRNVAGRHPHPQDPRDDRRAVLIGLLVLLVGLALVFGLPLFVIG